MFAEFERLIFLFIYFIFRLWTEGFEKRFKFFFFVNAYITSRCNMYYFKNVI